MFIDNKTFIFYKWLSWFFVRFPGPDPERPAPDALLPALTDRAAGRSLQAARGQWAGDKREEKRWPRQVQYAGRP